MNKFMEQKIIELQNSKTATEITQNAEYFVNILIENERLTKQLENAVVLPCKVGDTVYAIAKCCDVARKLDGSYYSSDGSPGTATGWYCAFDGNEDKCPLCGEDECNENDYAIFETKVLGLSYSDSDDDKGWHIYLENLDTYESYRSTKPEAEARLKELEERNV